MKVWRHKPHGVTTDDYVTDYLESVATFFENFVVDGKSDRAKYIRDPYGISLILEPFGVPLDDFPADCPEAGDVTCREYYLAAADGDIERLLPRMTHKERLFCDLAGRGLLGGVDGGVVVREVARAAGADVGMALAAWELQPDADALGFALGSPRAVLEGVTPALGVPLKFCYPSSLSDSLRFPCVVERDLFGVGEMVHVHRVDGEVVVFDSGGGVFEGLDVGGLAGLPASFVVEGFAVEGRFVAWDLLCWNGVWLHLRPLSERLRMLWRFHEWGQERVVVRSFEQLTGGVARNLGASYSPGRVGSHVFIEEVAKPGFLRVGGRKGRPSAHLLSEDGRAIFEIGVPIDREDYGDVVEVERDGTVVRVLGKKVVPDSWLELDGKWGLGDWEEFRYMRPRVIEWPEGEGS